MIYRGDQTMVTVQLRSLLDEGNPLADMRLKRDDIVFVPGQDRYVSVLGQVLRPGNERLDSRSTLSQLLADAGGITEKAGHDPAIQIIHRGTKTQIVSYKTLLDSKPLDLTLQSGDIIFVPQSGLDRVGYVFEKISPLVTLFTASALIAR
jgi:polysaccharide export outer membrane protein